MTLPQLILETFLDLFPQLIFLLPEMLPVVTFPCQKNTIQSGIHFIWYNGVRYGITSPLKLEIQHLLKASEKKFKIHCWSLMRSDVHCHSVIFKT